MEGGVRAIAEGMRCIRPPSGTRKPDRREEEGGAPPGCGPVR